MGATWKTNSWDGSWWTSPGLVDFLQVLQHPNRSACGHTLRGALCRENFKLAIFKKLDGEWQRVAVLTCGKRIWEAEHIGVCFAQGSLLRIEASSQDTRRSLEGCEWCGYVWNRTGDYFFDARWLHESHFRRWWKRTRITWCTDGRVGKCVDFAWVQSQKKNWQLWSLPVLPSSLTKSNWSKRVELEALPKGRWRSSWTKIADGIKLWKCPLCTMEVPKTNWWQISIYRKLTVLSIMQPLRNRRVLEDMARFLVWAPLLLN